MADYIERDALLKDKAFIKGGETCDSYVRGYLDALDDVEKAIKNAPAADVRPVVRCKDCKHKGWVQEPEHGRSVDYCRLIEKCVERQFFCAAGERKDGDGDV